jgi:hypothetical protein
MLLFLLVTPGTGHAQVQWPRHPLPDAVRLHVVSWHDRGDFNNANMGAALHWQGGLTAGGYYNSMRRASVYAGFTVPVYDRNAWRLDVMMGAITGYSDSEPAQPVLVPVLGWRLNPRNMVQVVFMPRFVLPANVVHLMVETRFGN